MKSEEEKIVLFSIVNLWLEERKNFLNSEIVKM